MDLGSWNVPDPSSLSEAKATMEGCSLRLTAVKSYVYSSRHHFMYPLRHVLELRKIDNLNPQFLLRKLQPILNLVNTDDPRRALYLCPLRST